MSVLFRLGGDQGYISSSFEELIEGTHCNFADSQKTKRDFLETINKAEKVIENDGVRVILIGKDEKQINPNFKTLTYSKKYFEIINYTGGDCFKFIRAPSLELALEFENWKRNGK